MDSDPIVHCPVGTLANRCGSLAFGALLIGLTVASCTGTPSINPTETQAIDNIPLPPNVAAVHAGSTYSYLVWSGQKAVLIDAGSDERGTALLASLAARGLSAGNVEAVLLTHGHADVRAAASIFPNATVYVGKEDFGLLRGDRLPRALFARLQARFSAPPPCPARVRIALPGEAIRIGSLRFDAIPTPGHTKGSLVFRYRDALFAGDSVRVDEKGLSLAPWYLTDSVRESSRSLARLRLLPYATLADAQGGRASEADVSAFQPGDG